MSAATAFVAHFFVLVLLATLSGCASVDLDGYRTVDVSKARAGVPEIDWQGVPLAGGQIVLNESPDATSLVFSLAADRFAPYTHVGIVVIDDGRPFVYESFGIYLPLPWTRPNALMAGGVRRVTFESFLARGGYVAIYDPPGGVDRGQLVHFARESLRRHVPFDGEFDLADARRFYCVEFVSRALEAAGGPRLVATRVTRNPSLRVGLAWLGIKGPSLELAGDLAVTERRVALLAFGRTERQIEAYFALKRELHRRFTPDQKLGSVVAWRGQHLELRPAIEAYFDRGMSTEEDPVQLADRLFGSMAPEAPRLVGR